MASTMSARDMTHGPPRRPMSAGSGIHSSGSVRGGLSRPPAEEAMDSLNFYPPARPMSGVTPVTRASTFGPPPSGGFKTFPKKIPAFAANSYLSGAPQTHHRAIVNAVGAGPNLALGDTLQVVDTLAGFRGLGAAAGEEGKAGVWVSRDLWKSMRHQLEQKAVDSQRAADQHAEVVRGYQKQLESERVRFKELEESYRRVQVQLQDQSAERERLAMSLAHELEVKTEQIEKQREEHGAQTDQLMRMLYERDGVEERVDSLTKSLDDTAFRLKMENHRAQLADAKVKALDKELSYHKERKQNDMLRVEKLEATAREATRALNEQRLQTESYKEEMLAVRKPDDSAQEELARYQTDCRRLTHMLEGTEQYKKMMADMAAMRGVHYVPLSECLVDEGLVSEVYAAERDRPVEIGDAEAMKWVPRRAIEVTHAFLERLFPKVPVQPFMSLLLQLNKVWKEHEKDLVEHVKAAHEKEQARLRRQRRQVEPYEKVILEQKVHSLRRQVREAGKRGEKLEKDKEVATKRGKEESKVLLEWGLSTIENLSKQVTRTSRENQSLRAHAYVDQGLGEAEVMRLAAAAAGGGEGAEGWASVTGAGAAPPTQQQVHDAIDGGAMRRGRSTPGGGSPDRGSSARGSSSHVSPAGGVRGGGAPV